MDRYTIDRVLELISDKTDILHNDYEEYSNSSMHGVLAEECLSQIIVLNELYEEVKLLRDDV